MTIPPMNYRGFLSNNQLRQLMDLTSSDEPATMSGEVDLSNAKNELEAFRSALWEFEPDAEYAGGLDRVGWLSGLLADIHSWIRDGVIRVEDHPDPSAFNECLGEVQLLAERLRAAMNEHPVRKAASSVPNAAEEPRGTA